MAPYGASSSGPYSAYSSPQQQQQQLAFMAAAGPMVAAGGYPSSNGAAPANLPPAPIHGPMPNFPVPFAPPPFAALLASGSVPVPLDGRPFYSVDVECVATGPGHNDRALGHVSVVDQHGAVVLNLYVRPSVAVASYLPAITGLSERECAAGVSEEEVREAFKRVIPPSAVLVGQNILKDVQWLRLEEGADFSSMLDLAGLFATRHPQFKSLTFFSLAHEAKALLALDQAEMHHPAVDAGLSIRLYDLYLHLQQHPAEMERARALLLQTPVEGAFNKKFPVYEGVCMGNRKACTCGSPWLG